MPQDLRIILPGTALFYRTQAKTMICITKVSGRVSPIFDHSIEFTIIICYSFSLIEKIISLIKIIFNIIN